MKKILGLIIFLLITLVCVSALADVLIDESNFPDPVFRKYLEKEYFKNLSDNTFFDNFLSDLEISLITHIDLSNEGVSSLQGIEFFPELNSIQCAGNNLSTLDLSNNPKVSYLNISNNNLTTLELNNLTELHHLSCQNNSLSTLDLGNNSKLTFLNCAQNNLSMLDLSNNPQLEELNCSGNNLSSLDVSHNPALNILQCNNNQLASIYFGVQKTLSSLNCQGNSNLTEIDITDCWVLADRLQKGWDDITGPQYTRNRDKEDYDYWGNGGGNYLANFMSVDKELTVIVGDHISTHEHIWSFREKTSEEIPGSSSEGLTYQSNPDGTCSVTGYSGSSSEIIVPEINPEGLAVTAIGPGAFSNQESIQRILLPDSVSEIGPEAFMNCENLSSINIPMGITVLPYRVFSGTGITGIELPDHITSIGESAFQGCMYLESVHIPERVTSIGASAFEHCSLLHEIIIPGNVTEIENVCFYDCYELTTVVLPEGITKIGDWAFRSCSNLKAINIPDSVTSIGEFAFFGDSQLKKIRIPESVTHIENSAFDFNVDIVECAKESYAWSYFSDSDRNVILLEVTDDPVPEDETTEIVFTGQAPIAAPMVDDVRSYYFRIILRSDKTVTVGSTNKFGADTLARMGTWEKTGNIINMDVSDNAVGNKITLADDGTAEVEFMGSLVQIKIPNGAEEFFDLTD